MDTIVRQCLEWILTECKDAPVEIRRYALTAVCGIAPVGGLSKIGNIAVSNDTYVQCEQSMVDGRKLEAIKILRRMSGCGLKEAKEAVETEFESVLNQAHALEERGF